MLLEGENGLTYWCMLAITLLPTLYCFFLTSSFFFLSFLLPFLSFSYSPVGLLCSLLLFLSCCSVLPCSPFPVHGGRPFYTTCHEGILLLYPLTALYGCGCSSRPPTGLSATQSPPLTYAGHATSHFQTKSLILFACSPWHSHPDKGRHSLSLSLMACT